MVFTSTKSKTSKLVFLSGTLSHHNTASAVSERGSDRVKGGVIMTRNQVSYAQHREQARHNRAAEKTNQHQADTARMDAYTRSRSADESARHNREDEATNWFNATSRDIYNQAAADATQKQAAAALTQAAIAQERADTGNRQQDLAEKQFGLQQGSTISSETRRWLETLLTGGLGSLIGGVLNGT